MVSAITMALGFVVGATLISITDGGVLGYVLSAMSIALAYGIIDRGIRPYFDRRRKGELWQE